MSDDPQFAPWGVVSPTFWHHDADPAAAATDARPLPPPAKYHDQITAATTNLDTHDPQRLARAQAETEQLDEQITADFGPAHTHTIQIRELRGHIAHLQEDHATATRWYLHTTALQNTAAGPRHPLTQASAQRAVYTWAAIPDTHTSITIGTELLSMLTTVTGETSNTTRGVRARLQKMQARHSPSG